MTPKEKAKELIDKYARLDGYDDSIDLSKCEFEKKCALIAVDEILWLLNEISHDANIDSEVNFYNEVKQEIEKLTD